MANDTMRRLSQRLLDILRDHDKPMRPGEIKAKAGLIQQAFTIEIALQRLVAEGAAKAHEGGCFSLPGCTVPVLKIPRPVKECIRKEMEFRPGVQIDKAMVIVVDLLSRKSPLKAGVINTEGAQAGIRQTTMKNARRRLINEGYLVRTGKGLYILRDQAMHTKQTDAAAKGA